MKKLITIYLLLCVIIACGIYFIVPKSEHTTVSSIITGVNTSAFREGSVLVLGDNGEMRMALDADTVSDVIGIVTVRDSIDGEIIIKYTK